jgi:hypothetical protein
VQAAWRASNNAPGGFGLLEAVGILSSALRLIGWELIVQVRGDCLMVRLL